MKAGRELDALVAEVLGIKFIRKTVGLGRWEREILLLVDEACKCHTCTASGNTEMIHGPLMHGMVYPEVRPYSTQIGAAWEVVTKLSAEDWDFEMNFYRWRDDGRVGWFVSIGRAESLADTAPHAICLAALRTKEEKV